ncbi:hypothetical protein GDO86_009264 [Hymenochirus boettgeri]|uniref:Uncharacterized protein n=1 Tax=Hymenochirus boettgeri TaxID=247094 RepID=A0A8T2JJX7_9PIPI|nr:hypothetical protein GDO86_009264 [Hymenochirus boettgeri]
MENMQKVLKRKFKMTCILCMYDSRNLQMQKINTNVLFSNFNNQSQNVVHFINCKKGLLLLKYLENLHNNVKLITQFITCM